MLNSRSLDRPVDKKDSKNSASYILFDCKPSAKCIRLGNYFILLKLPGNSVSILELAKTFSVSKTYGCPL